MRTLFICIALIAISLTSFTQDKNKDVKNLRMEQVSSAPLDKDVDPNELKRELHGLIQIDGGTVIPAPGYTLWQAMGIKETCIWIIEEGQAKKISENISKENKEDDGPTIFNFVFVGQFGISGGDMNYLYCSCGSNLYEKEGDDCVVYTDATGLKCGGTCSGSESGKECSVTLLSIGPHGTTTRNL